MKINSIISVAVMAAMSMSCTAKGDASGSVASNTAASAPAASSFPFMKRLGIDTRQLKVLGNEIFDGGDDINALTLTREQYTRLLSDVYQFERTTEDDIEGNFFVPAVRALPGGYTLVVYLVEFGDGSNQELAVYDSAGKLTDYLDADTWHSMDYVDMSEDFSQGTGYNSTGSMQFDSDNEFHVTLEYSLVDWKNKGEWQKEVTNTHWSIRNVYHYRIDAQGHLSLVEIDEKTQGNPDADILFRQKIIRMCLYPRSDASRLDALNTEVDPPAVAAQLGDPDGSIDYEIEQVLGLYYRQNAAQVLTWMAAHRGADNRLVKKFEQLFSMGWLKKEQLIDDINRLPDAAARAYLSKLTAQWGPEDAVG